MNKLKILVVGPGLIGKQHIKLINESKRCQLSCIVAPDHLNNNLVAKANNTKIYYSLRECLENENVDGVIISSPNQFHANQARICIEARIPVLIEKPITSLVEDAVSLVQLAEKNNSKVIVGHHRTYSPIMANARQVIQSGQLGRLVSIVGSAQFYKPTHYFSDGPWRKEKGGGPILINLIHEIGNLRTLCGEISAVQAIASSAIREFAVEDTVAINLVFESGVLGTFMLSDTAASAQSWEQTSRENSSYPSYSDIDCYTVTGTLGTLHLPTMRIKRYPIGVEPSWWTPFKEEIVDIDRHDPLRCQLDHFIDVILDESSPSVSARDGLRNLLVTEAVRKSIEEKKLILLEK